MAVARIQLRRDTSSNWTTANTILTEGELGYETNTSKVKIGDGTTPWNSLNYLIYPLSFSDLVTTPTTIAGYGITDAFDGVFSSLTSTPTTIAGYGITDAFDGAFSSLTNTPTTLGGYGITDSFDGAFSSLTGTPTTLAGYGITDSFDGAFSSLTGTPTTLAGYGITDGSTFDGAFSSLTGKPTTLAGYGITDAFDGAFSSLTFKPTTISGYGITDAFNGAFSSLSGTPTTLAGYGITDAAPLQSPGFTGTPTAPTAPTGTNTTQIATTAFVETAVSNVIDSAPGALDTLNELAAALGDDANFSTTITNSIATKAPLASASLTGTPTAPTAATGTNTTQIATTAFVQSAAGAKSSLTDFSVSTATASGVGSLSYNNTTGVFTFTPAQGFDGAFSSLTGKPTTIAGYGITDAFDGAFSSLTGRPTTIAGYGITDALTTGADADIGSNDFITTGKAYFANMFANTGDLPSATTYHGMFAHVHSTGAAYFAHAGNWIQLANNSDVTTKAPLASPSFTGIPIAPTATSGTNTTQIATTEFVTAAVAGASGTYTDSSVDTHLNTSTASSGEVLSWNGTDYDWVAQSGGGGGASVTTSDSAPSSPSAGDLWYNTDAGGLFVYYTDADSSQWVEVVGKTGPTGATGAAGGSTITVSDAAPSSPVAGQLWWNSTSNKLYIYYTDANSSQWVQATTPGATGPAGPAGGITHQDTWRLSSNVTSDTSPITTWTNTAANSTFQTTLGSPMTVSGGYFTFPVTGYWRVEFFARVNLTTSDNLNIGIGGALYSSGTLQTFTGLALQTVGDTGYVKTASVATHINVTNTADIKTGFYTSSVTSGNSLIASGSSTDYSYVMFTRLADAV